MLYLFILHFALNIVFLNAQYYDNNGFPGTVELLQNHRKSRLSRDFESTNENLSVKDETPRYLRNFQPYIDKDTENLTDQQKQLLKNIADRIARYGVSMMNPNQTNPLHDEEGRASKTTAGKPLSSIKATSTLPSSSTISSSTTKLNIKATTEAGIKTTGTNRADSKVQQPHQQKSTLIVDSKRISLKEQLPIKINKENEPPAIMFGDNATTATIIDSLSRDNAREDFYVRERPQSENSKNNNNNKVRIKKKTISPKGVRSHQILLM